MTEASIRAAVRADAPAIAAFQTAAWADSYAGIVPDGYLAAMTADERERRWDARIESGSRRVALAEEGSRVLGVVSWRDGIEDAVLPARELASLYIGRSAWGTGLGQRLLEHAIGTDAAWLWVFEANGRAIRFYEKHAFRADDGRRVDPDTGVPEVRMVRR